MTTGRERVPAQLLQQAVDTAADFFPRLADALNRVAQELQADRLADGLTLFNTAQDGLQWFCHMVELRAVWLAERPCRAVDEAWPPFVDAIAAAAEALGRADYVYVSDLLLYEIIPFIEQVLASIRDWQEERQRHAV